MNSFRIAQIGTCTASELRPYNPLLTKEKVFICPECGEKKAFIELEIWPSDTAEDVCNNVILCSKCYADQMEDYLKFTKR